MRQSEAFKYYFGLTKHQVEVLFELVLHSPVQVKTMLWQRLGRCLMVWLTASSILAVTSSTLLLGWPVRITNAVAFFGLIIIVSAVLLPWLLSSSMLLQTWHDLRFLQRGVPLIANGAPRPEWVQLLDSELTHVFGQSASTIYVPAQPASLDAALCLLQRYGAEVNQVAELPGGVASLNPAYQGKLVQQTAASIRSCFAVRTSASEDAPLSTTTR
jgi:hypothetical protein